MSDRLGYSLLPIVQDVLDPLGFQNRCILQAGHVLGSTVRDHELSYLVRRCQLYRRLVREAVSHVQHRAPLDQDRDHSRFA